MAKKSTVKQDRPCYEFDPSDSTFRTLIVDSDKLFITPLYSDEGAGGFLTMKNLKREVEKHNTPCKELLYLSNGAYFYKPYSPLGDHYGYNYAYDMFRKQWYKWQPLGSYTHPCKRWYFAITKHGKAIIRHPAASATSTDPYAGYVRDSASAASIAREYKLIMHGLVMLFNQKVPFVDSLATFKRNINTNNDRFQKPKPTDHDQTVGKFSAYEQLGSGSPRAIWVIGIVEGGEKFVIISSGQGKTELSGKPIFEVAKSLSKMKVKVDNVKKPIVEAIAFDGGGSHTIWARPDLNKDFPKHPQAISNRGICTYFGIFKVPNVWFNSIGGINIPKGISIDRNPIVIYTKSSYQFVINAEVKDSNHFKPTARVELVIMNSSTYRMKYTQGLEVDLKTECTRATWKPKGACFNDRKLQVKFNESQRKGLITLAKKDAGNLIFIVRSLDKTGQTLHESAIPVRLCTGYRYLFVLDDLLPEDPQNKLINARNKAARELAVKLKSQADSYIVSHPGFSFQIRALSYKSPMTGAWTDKLSAFYNQVNQIQGKHHAKQYHSYTYTAVLFASGFGDMNKDPLITRKAMIFLAHKSYVLPENPDLNPPQPRKKAAANLDQMSEYWASKGMVVNCVGFGNVTHILMQKAAQNTGGAYVYAKSVGGIPGAFITAHDRSRNTKIVKDLTLYLSSVTSITEKVLLSKKQRLMFRFYWDNIEPAITLRAPNGDPIDAHNLPDGAEYVTGYKCAFFIINSATEFDVPDTPWTIEISRRRKGKDAVQMMAVETDHNMIDPAPAPGTDPDPDPGPLPDPELPPSGVDFVSWFFEWDKKKPEGNTITSARDQMNYSQVLMNLKRKEIIFSPRNVYHDPRDGGLWVCYSPRRNDSHHYELGKFKLDGSFKKRQVGMQPSAIGFDHNHNCVWLGRVQTFSVIDLKTGQEKQCKLPYKNFRSCSVAVSNGYAFAGAYVGSGIYKFSSKGTVTAFNRTVQVPMHINIQKNGELVCFCFKDRKIYRLNSKGRVIKKSDKLNGYADGLVWDEVGQRVWTYSHLRVQCFDNDFKRIFNLTPQGKLNGIRVYSMAVNRLEGGVLICGRRQPESKGGFIGRVDSQGNVSVAYTKHKYNMIFTAKLP